MRPRIACGADICSIAMLLAVCAISAAPPTKLSASGRHASGLAATPMIAEAITRIQPAWISAWRSARRERVGDEAAERAADADRGEQHAEALRPGGEHVLGIDREQRPPDRDEQEERQRADREQHARARVARREAQAFESCRPAPSGPCGRRRARGKHDEEHHRARKPRTARPA